MMESLDEQLARLDAEYQQKQARRAAQSSSPQQDPSHQDEGLDDLLNALAQTQSESGVQSTPSPGEESRLDEILTQVESEQKQKKAQPIVPSPDLSLEQRLEEISSPSSSQGQSPAHPTQAIDEFLAEIESAQTQKARQQKPESPADSGLDHVLNEITTSFVARPSPPPPSQQSETNQHLKQIASQYRPEDVAQALQSLEQKQEEQRLSAKRQQRQREALKQKAQAWLKQLDPHSEEGLWFEEFAYAYESKLDAAMDYLSALGEVR